MKLSRTSWILIIVGVFLTAFASLGAVGSQQISQRNDLSEELDLMETQINSTHLGQVSYEPEELEAQLEEIQSELEISMAAFSEPSWNIITDTLFEIADNCGVEITIINSSQRSQKNLEGVACSILTISASVEGNVDNLIGFVTVLNRDLETSVVESVSINIPEADSGEIPVANIQLQIYTYQGD